jgi:predicted esterase YcpF (UPF0227 family)
MDEDSKSVGKTIQSIMAHGFAGCCGSVLGALLVAVIAYAMKDIWIATRQIDHDSMAQAGAELDAFIKKTVLVITGFFFGGLGGFVAGALTNALLIRRAGRPAKDSQGNRPKS